MRYALTQVVSSLRMRVNTPLWDVNVTDVYANKGGVVNLTLLTLEAVAFGVPC